MVVYTEIERELGRANDAYIECLKRYIEQAKLGNDVYQLFTWINTLMVCRKSLTYYDLENPQIDEPAFNHIVDLINGISTLIFGVRQYISEDYSSIYAPKTIIMTVGSYLYRQVINNETQVVTIPDQGDATFYIEVVSYEVDDMEAKGMVFIDTSLVTSTQFTVVVDSSIVGGTLVYRLQQYN